MDLIHPKKISVEKNNIVRKRIIKLIKNGQMSFQTFLDYFEEYYITDPEIALIIIYYTNNAMLKNQDMTEKYRIDLITAMLDDLNTKHDIDYNKYK